MQIVFIIFIGILNVTSLRLNGKTYVPIDDYTDDLTPEEIAQQLGFSLPPLNEAPVVLNEGLTIENEQTKSKLQSSEIDDFFVIETKPMPRLTSKSTTRKLKTTTHIPTDSDEINELVESLKTTRTTSTTSTRSTTTPSSTTTSSTTHSTTTPTVTSTESTTTSEPKTFVIDSDDNTETTTMTTLKSTTSNVHPTTVLIDGEAKVVRASNSTTVPSTTTTAISTAISTAMSTALSTALSTKILRPFVVTSKPQTSSQVPKLSKGSIQFVANCVYYAALCRGRGRYAAFVKKYCVETCRVYEQNVRKPKRCYDRAKNCKTLRSHCHQPHSPYRSVLEKTCRRTCRICKPKRKGGGKRPKPLPFNVGLPVSNSQNRDDECKDISKNCHKYLDQCNDEVMAPTLTKFCARSCGFCATCEDQWQDKCPSLVRRGFCTSPHFRLAIKRRYCAFSCSLCQKRSNIHIDFLPPLPLPKNKNHI